MAIFLLPSVLMIHADDQKAIEASGRTVSEALDDVSARHPELVRLVRGPDGRTSFVNIYVNDDDIRSLAGLETPVEKDDRITLLPAVAGG